MSSPTDATWRRTCWRLLRTESELEIVLRVGTKHLAANALKRLGTEIVLYVEMDGRLLAMIVLVIKKQRFK